jgi:hypothetical protein
MPDVLLERKFSEALLQGSAIREVNGVVPTTRTGCSFGLIALGVGYNLDPSAKVPAFDLEIDIPAMVRRYNSAFLVNAPLADVGDRFVGIELIPRVRFSVGAAILRRARAVESDNAVIGSS